MQPPSSAPSLPSTLRSSATTFHPNAVSPSAIGCIDCRFLPARDGDIGAVDIDERDGLSFFQMHQISLSFTGEPQNIPAMGVRHANRL